MRWCGWSVLEIARDYSIHLKRRMPRTCRIGVNSCRWNHLVTLYGPTGDYHHFFRHRRSSLSSLSLSLSLSTLSPNPRLHFSLYVTKHARESYPFFLPPVSSSLCIELREKKKRRGGERGGISVCGFGGGACWSTTFVATTTAATNEHPPPPLPLYEATMRILQLRQSRLKKSVDSCTSSAIRRITIRGKREEKKRKEQKKEKKRKKERKRQRGGRSLSPAERKTCLPINSCDVTTLFLFFSFSFRLPLRRRSSFVFPTFREVHASSLPRRWLVLPRGRCAEKRSTKNVDGRDAWRRHDFRNPFLGRASPPARTHRGRSVRFFSQRLISGLFLFGHLNANLSSARTNPLLGFLYLRRDSREF